MTPVDQTRVAELLEQDVDDIAHQAEHLTKDRKIAFVKLIVSAVPELNDETARLKALSFVQAALGSLTTRSVSVGTAGSTVEAVREFIDATAHPWDVRRAAFNVLALVFLRVRSLTPKVEAQVRTAFKTGKRDPHPSIRDFARRALAEGGVLEQRKSPAAKTFATRFRDIITLRGAGTVFGRHAVPSRPSHRRSGKKESRRTPPRARSTT